jgi:hypothetical protein
VKYLIDKVVDDVNKLHVIIFFTLETWKGWFEEKKINIRIKMKSIRIFFFTTTTKNDIE